MSLDGKIAFVTGSATGIGAAIAKELASSDVKVIGADIAVSSNAAAPLEIKQIQRDLADPDSVQQCFADVEERHGGIDILVNNAAIASALVPTPFDQISPEEWARVVTVNTMMPFLYSRAVVPQMRKRSGAGSSTSPRPRSSSARRSCCTTPRARVPSP